MAQKTGSSSSRSTRSRSSSRSTSRNGSSKSTRSAGSTKNTRSRNGASSTRRTPRKASTNGPVAKTGEKVAEVVSKATPQTETVKRTRKKVGDFASKAKTPLVAGGAALAGIAGGVALKSRTENKRPVGKLKTRKLPESLRNIDLSKVDLDAVTKAAKRIASVGEQVGDVADAADKTRKKHK
jgi:hypothetical protein